MNNWKKGLYFLIILMVIILSYYSINNVIKVFAPTTSPAGYRIDEIHYNKDGIDAYYPQFVSDTKQEDIWNQIIQKDFNKILDIYSFNPFPEKVQAPSGAEAVLLNIKNEVKVVNQKYFSTLYTAAYNSPYSAHPSELVYTTNIDLTNNKRMRLSDIIEPDVNFIKFFRTLDPITSEAGDEEIKKAVKDYINGFSDEELHKGFEAADTIGSANTFGIYSYLLPDRLGISISVPHYAGDHVEFEEEYTKIKEYLKPEFISGMKIADK